MTVSVESRESRFVRRSLLNGDSLVTGTRDAPPYCFGASRGGLRLWRDRDIVRDVLDELVAGVINRKLAAETQHVIPGRQTMDKGEETIGYGRRHCAADINSKELVQVVGRRQPEGKRPRPQPGEWNRRAIQGREKACCTVHGRGDNLFQYRYAGWVPQNHAAQVRRCQNIVPLRIDEGEKQRRALFDADRARDLAQDVSGHCEGSGERAAQEQQLSTAAWAVK